MIFDLFLFQDDMAEKLGNATAEQSDSESSSSSSSSDGSSSSGIGLKRGPAAKPKPKRKAKAAPKPAPEDDQKKPQTKEPEKVEKALGPAALLEKAKQCLDSLCQVTSQALWTNSIKEKDVHARIAKGVDCASKCENYPGEPSLAEILEQLNQEVGRVNVQSEVLHELSSQAGAGVVPILEHKKNDLLSIVLPWKVDDIVSLLNDIGRKLCEAFISSDGEDARFFKFVVIAPDSFDGFGFGFLYQECLKDDSRQAIISGIAQSQLTLVNSFLDRFRSMGPSTEALIRSIPRDLFLPEICRPDFIVDHALVTDWQDWSHFRDDMI